MVLARVANLFSPAIPTSVVDNGQRDGSFTMEGPALLSHNKGEAGPVGTEEVDHEAARPPYTHV